MPTSSREERDEKMEAPLSKFQAFGIHLGISLLVFFVFLYLLFFHWYPGFFYHTDGGWEGIRIVAGVDLVLGPLLTLIVYKPGKPKLKLDLSIIAAIQIACLAVGVSIVYKERPLAIVFSKNQFYTLNMNYYKAFEVDISSLEKISGPTPKQVYVEYPTDPTEIAVLEALSFLGGPLYVRTEHYLNYQPHIPNILKEGLSYAEIKEQRSQDDLNKLEKWKNKHPKLFEIVSFIPVEAKYQNGYIIMRENGELIDFININPLESKQKI